MIDSLSCSIYRYGPEGEILPSLAESWSVENLPSGKGQEYTFFLREGVTFHDGEPWNCQAAKMNFDHVMAKPLRTGDWHGWYGIPKYIDEWSCEGDMEFHITTTENYYPFLQELTFIRPLRMLSPAAFANGSTTDPITANSCHAGWGEVSLEGEETITCAGIANISGTGPFAFKANYLDSVVIFDRNENYWAGAPAIETLKIHRYEEPENVKEALKNGTLDVVWGSGVLQSRDLNELAEEDNLSVFHSDVIQHVIILLNTGKAPLNDIQARKTVIHAIDKEAIIEKELGNVQRPVDTVFPMDTPYSGFELSPRWAYDFEKAMLLSCEFDHDGHDEDDHDDEDSHDGHDHGETEVLGDSSSWRTTNQALPTTVACLVGLSASFFFM